MELIDRTVTYLNDNLGTIISPHKIKNEKLLPPYLRQRYNLYNTSILNNDCLLLLDKEIEDSTPAAIRKHIDTISERENTEAIYVCSSMDSYNRKRLIEQRVSFIVPGNQMFLPFIGIDLREHMKNIRIKKETFSPSAQLLLLSLLLRKLKNGVTPGEAAKLLGYSSMTMTRAFDELEENRIGTHSSKGKHRLLIIEEDPKDIWKKALPLLGSPQKRTISINPIEAVLGYKKSGDSALSHYTMLAEPKNPVYAVSENEFKALKHDDKFKVVPYLERDSVIIEIWKYLPGLLSETDVVDTLSLYLSMKDIEDERIESSLAELLDKAGW